MPDRAPFTIEPIVGRTVARLTSWLPEIRTGGKHVVLAGRELPSRVGGRLRGPIRALCIGPGDWLMVSHQHDFVVVRDHVAADLPPHGLTLVDVSHALAGLEVRGPMARELLSKGCGLDFHPRSFPVESCARTRFAQIPVVIESREEESRFELFVARSLAAWLRSWLEDAALELGGLRGKG